MDIVTHTINQNNERCIIHSSEVDAKFIHNGMPVYMTYNMISGPTFTGQTLEDFWPDDSEEFETLWNQFDGWWNAKGKFIYATTEI